MSTRGVVAIRREDGGWTGVYNHWDSYPTGLGEEVFAHVRAVPARYRQDFALKLLQYDDWREYQNEGVCEYCGVAGLGQPHSINMSTNDHQHSRDHGESPSENHITSEDFGETWCEWAYVIDPFKQEIEVISKYYGSRGTFPIDADFDAEAVEKAAYGEDEED